MEPWQWQVSTILSFSNPLVVLLLGASIAVTVWTFLTIDPLSGWKLRTGLTLLRLTTLLLAVYLLMQPSLIVTRSAPRSTPLAVVFDVSASMGYPVQSDRLSTCVDRIRQGLERSGLAKQLELHFFGFAKSLHEVESIDGIGLDRQGGEGTDFRGALHSLSQLSDEAEFAGVLLCSDGADTSMITDDEVRELHLPVNTVFAGSDSRQKDLLVKEVRVDDFAFSRKENPIEVRVENHGFPITELKVNLISEGKLLQQKLATVIDGHGELTFKVVPKTTGRHIYKVEIPTLPEEDLTDNNVRFVEMKVVRDKYRVLHLSGAPTWDQRFLRDSFTQWPRVDLVSFYLLRTTYQSTTQSNAGLSLIPFPTEGLFSGHLKEFDLIVFQDFDPATVGVDTYMDAIAEYVEDGGALVIAGGPGGLTAPSITNSKLAKLLPVALPRANTPQARLFSDAPFSPTLTETGSRHPLFVHSGATEAAAEQLRSLPRLNGIVRTVAVQPGGQVLLEHPYIRTDSGGAPLLSVSEPAKGRVIVIATDSLWNWGFSAAMTGAPAQFYTDFWKQAVLWATHSEELSRISLSLDRKNAFLGTPVQLNVSLRDMEYRPAAGQPVHIEVAWTDKNEQLQTKSFDGMTNDSGTYRQGFTPIEAGAHNVRISSEALQASLDDVFLVASANQEMNNMSPDAGRLREISETSNGHFFEGQVALEDVQMNATPGTHILSRQDYGLWSHPLVLLLLFGLLAADWLLRKWRGIA